MMKNSPEAQTLKAGPPRILIVDNDERTRRAYQDLLTYWGYLPILAQGDGIFLLEDATKAAHDQRCQLALVDLRLMDNFDETDKGGLTLIPKLAPAKCIIFSGFATPEDFSKGLEEGAVGFFHKTAELNVRRREIDKAAQRICSQKRTLGIEPAEILEEIARRVLGHQVPEQYHDQILDAFARLFPQAQHLWVERLGTSQPTNDFLSVPRPRSIILSVREDDHQPVIVKLARAAKTKKEVENYQSHIIGKIKWRFCPVLINHSLLWDIGGISLSYVGNLEQTFANYYREQSLGKIKKSLNDFFKETWSQHYRDAVEIEDGSLFRLYCQVWGNEWVDRIRNFQGFHPDKAMNAERCARFEPPDPFVWMKTNILEAKDGSRMKKIRLAVTHGDLHGDNMLVDKNNNIWVVDFERTQPGHILQDFIELEADIINRLPCTSDNISAFFSLCVAVSREIKIKGLTTDQFIEANEDVRKAFLTISHLRKLARECTTLSDSREYLIGLLFNTLFRATITTNHQRQECRQRILMLASILCHRLDHWNEPWPPPDWNQH